MQGKNPIRPPIQNDGQQLDVKKLFATLQGEGPYAGQPAVFIRLGGCNLACSFCDTDFENFTAMPLDDIIAKAKLLAQENGERVRDLIVITGGEPLRQNIVPLCEKLLAENFNVQIETNGTLWRELPEKVDIVCSPKHTGMGYMKIRDDLLKRLSALKFIVSAHDDNYNNIGDVGQGIYHTPVYVQPMDKQDKKLNAENVAHALSLAQKHGYFLSLQTHKLLGIE